MRLSVVAAALFFGALVGCGIVLAFAAAGWARITPAQAAAGFKDSYNCEGRWHTAQCGRQKYRITLMRCVASRVDPRVYFDCYVKIARRDGQSVPMCGAVVIDSGFDVLENHIVACTKVPPATHTA